MAMRLTCYRIESRDENDGFWKNYSFTYPKTEVVEELVRRPIIFWKRKVVKKIRNIAATVSVARMEALRRARRLYEGVEGQDTRLYQVAIFDSDSRECDFKIWENGKFTN